MKIKLIALSILLMLLVSPLSGIVFAQEDTGDDGTGDGTEGDGTTGDGGEDDGTGDDSEDDGTTGEEDDSEGEGNIDPGIYEQIRQQSRERFQEMYQLMFGSVSPTSVEDTGEGGDGTTGDGTDGSEGDGTEGDEELPEYDGPVIPEDVDPALRNQFMNAWAAMQGAEEKENPQAAANQYLRAMKQLRNTYRKYQKDNPEVVEDLTEGEDAGVPEGEVPDAPTEGELDETKQELVGRFQERFQERVTQMLQNYEDVEDTLSPDDSVKAFNALTKAEAKLLRIQERINAGDIEGALDDLDGTTDELDEDLDSLEDDSSAQMFRTMNKLEARISKMAEQAAKKAARGEDTSDLDSALANARGNKDKTKDDFKEDKGKGNSGNSGNSGKPDKDTGKPDKDKGNSGKSKDK